MNGIRLDWAAISAQLDEEGHALLPGWLGAEAARSLARRVSAPGTVRVPLVDIGLGSGELFRFEAGLPASLEAWRTALYPRLVTIANRWNHTLGVEARYPLAFSEFVQRNRQAGQWRGQSHLSRLGVDDHLLLHQRNGGEQVFPLQLVALLSEPGVDFEGGEFVTTEQRPRLQSRPAVLPLRWGDAAIIATDARPVQGSRGPYRTRLRHAIGRVRRGERIGLELSFHDAR
ncbi:MAG: prolyl 4-hydroxylase [Hydrogenophaga sp.]|uniref:2OG-Fe(II) oxygenase n=1 Tax=Hydrogenophaga sp. TaxID=1904254 RepID=UPI0016AFC762|nr:2OG-Fe(II) oxygenase [Hydrogenophaga sp.]NIM43583.1 prolyl 4-hydroxylase [Hydrogenophaga sp.]NIN28652.1 prolyl 4-hydroxylase [Hydrogenophaga sp.]NIN33111.1 prolyl 4-hydroxylase [Hydrogenophaga sp.]NIN57786.1 prolyl 4-hydroxylase [Hydrogenophaga sp.]NIO54081.1 prolyl 4-hydroxylase [Hydrogenophaga sp.]